MRRRIAKMLKIMKIAPYPRLISRTPPPSDPRTPSATLKVIQNSLEKLPERRSHDPRPSWAAATLAAAQEGRGQMGRAVFSSKF